MKGAAIRILIDTSYAQRAPYSGTAVYLRELVRALSGEPGVEVLTTRNGRRRPPAGGGVGSVVNLAADLAWSGLGLPARARRAGADVIHHPLPAHSPLTASAQVVTVLDLAFERLPDLFAPGYRRFAHVEHRAAARAAAAVVCISATTAADVRELWGVSEERIVVAALGPGQADGPPPAQPADPSYFLYIGDAEPRKNLAALLRAYVLYRDRAPRPLELVLAGTLPAALAQASGIRHVERPSPPVLRGLLAGAAALVHPSLYEGFGLTCLEAMALGVPVIAARSPGIVEVCADAVRYVDPRRPEEIALALTQAGDDPAVRAQLRRRGLERAAAFSWRECARRHLDAYSLALGR